MSETRSPSYGLPRAMRNAVVVGAALALVGAAVGVATGAIPSSTDGKIYACYSTTTAKTYLIDYQAGQRCSATNEKLVWWNQVGPSGPQGPVGPRGATGATGPVGPTGVAGANGAVGPTGPTGEVGPSGPAGEVGPSGPAGEIGPTGPAGEVGPTGPTGAGGSSDAWFTDRTLVVVPNSQYEETVTAEVADLPPGKYLFTYTTLAAGNNDSQTLGNQLQCSLYFGNTRTFQGGIAWGVMSNNPVSPTQNRVPYAFTGAIDYSGDPFTASVRCGTNNTGDMIAYFSRLTVIKVGTLTLSPS